MKVRSGFVSNSSTTSFCIYGVSFESDADALKGIDVSSFDVKDFDPESNEVMDALYELQGKLGRGWTVIESPYDLIYFGRELGYMKDDETFGQWKKDIDNVLERLYPGRGLKAGTHEDAWRDG